MTCTLHDIHHIYTYITYTLQYIYITLRIHYICIYITYTLHYIHYIAVHCITYITLHTLHDITLHYMMKKMKFEKKTCEIEASFYFTSYGIA